MTSFHTSTVCLLQNKSLISMIVSFFKPGVEFVSKAILLLAALKSVKSRQAWLFIACVVLKASVSSVAASAAGLQTLGLGLLPVNH